MSPQSCPHPNHKTCDCYSSCQRGIKVADEIEVATQLTLKLRRICWIIWVCPNGIMSVLKSGRGQSVAVWKGLDPPLLALKMEVRGPQTKEYGWLTEARKGKKIDSLLGPAKRYTVLLTHGFYSSETCV